MTKFNDLDHLGLVFELYSVEIFRFVQKTQISDLELSLRAESLDSGSVFDVVELRHHMNEVWAEIRHGQLLVYEIREISTIRAPEKNRSSDWVSDCSLASNAPRSLA